MSAMHRALQVNVKEDLLPLSALLHQRGVAHRIYEERGHQVVMVVEAEHAPQVQALYKSWRAGELSIQLSRRKAVAMQSRRGEAQWREVPVTLFLLAMGVLGFLLVYFGPLNPLASYFTFTPFSVTADEDLVQSMQGQYWRFITPAFLHFGWLHIVFNSLWLWDLGTKVEKVMGHFNMIMLFLVIALVANVTQYLFGGVGIFGGMSGVVYGLLGFSWVAPLVQPRWLIQPTSTLMLFMVGWLVLCLFGVIEMVGMGAIANAAHIGGLLCGAALGLLFGLVSRLEGGASGRGNSDNTENS